MTVIILTMIIERPAEVKRINEVPKWTLVYGRRKTGKSFLVENFAKWDEYFFVKHDRTIISKKDNKTISYETFLEVLWRALEDGKTLVVDEFHRLGMDFFDLLHASKKQGKLILISSTLFLATKLISPKSPLLGLFAEVPVGLISTADCFNALKNNYVEKKEVSEVSILAREPLFIEQLAAGNSARNTFAKVLRASAKTIPALVGEIFTEEERVISAIYEGILRATATGKNVSSEISSYLFSRKLLQKDDPSVIQRHLGNLVDFGIIKKIKVFEKNRFIYRHVSPLTWLFYYSDEKYNVTERNLSEGESVRIVNELMPHIMEDQLREFISQRKGLVETVVQEKEFGIDGLLLRFRKPEIVIEVKWKEKIDKSDVVQTEKNLERINAKEKWLVVPDKKLVKIKTKLKVVDIADFL